MGQTIHCTSLFRGENELSALVYTTLTIFYVDFATSVKQHCHLLHPSNLI